MDVFQNNYNLLKLGLERNSFDGSVFNLTAFVLDGIDASLSLWPLGSCSNSPSV